MPSANSASYYLTCISTTSQTLHCNLESEQCWSLPIYRQPAKLLRRPLCRLNQPYREMQRIPTVSKEADSPDLVTYDAGTCYGSCWDVVGQAVLTNWASFSIKKEKTEGKWAGPLPNLDCPPDDIDRDKSTKAIATNVITAVTTAPRTATPLKDDSVYSAPQNSTATDIQGPSSSSPGAIHITYDEE